MTAVSLQLEFPPPPAGKQGWPWLGTSVVPSKDRISLPKISVVTPSYNQGKFLEQTIRSVLLQNYPNLEYFVIDGGSQDESVEIIRKYEPWLTYWISERDRGQSHAINKGFTRTTGEIMCWLNSDDYFAPHALGTVSEWLAATTGNLALVGHTIAVFQDGRAPVLGRGNYESRLRLLKYWKGYQMHQPSIFWRREVFEKVGLLKENLHLIMDFDYWARITEHYSFTNVDQVLSYCNQHPAAKTSDNCVSALRDMRLHRHSYWGSKFDLSYWKLEMSLLWHSEIVPVLRKFTMI